MSDPGPESDDDESTEFAELGAHRFDVLRAQLATAQHEDDGSPSKRRRHVEAAVAMIVALVDELDEAAAESELAGLWPLVAHDALLEIDTRRRLARELIEVGDHDLAFEILEGAMTVARDRKLVALQADLAIAIAVARNDRARRIVQPQVVAAPLTPELAARLELAQEGEEHARKAVEYARRAGDLSLLHEATVALAESLAAREELAEAEAMLKSLPPVDDAREANALLEEIWRRRGLEIVDDPDEPDEHATIDRQLRAYITKPRNFSQALADGGLAGRDRVREWSFGELREPADLESQRIFGPVRSFWCACGRYRGRTYAGLVCKRCGVESIHASSRCTRSGHITLATPVVHPWYAPAAAQLLNVTLQEIEALPVETLRERLREIDLEWLADDVKRDIITAPKAKIADAAGRRLALIEGFRNARKTAYTRPEDIVLDIVPVVPPHGDLGCDRERARAAYAEILESAEPRIAVRKLFDAFAG